MLSALPCGFLPGPQFHDSTLEKPMRFGDLIRRITLLTIAAPMCVAQQTGVAIDNQAFASFTASATAQQQDSNTVRTLTVAGLQPGDVSITKSTSAVNPRQGDIIDFTLVARNAAAVDVLGKAITIDGAPASKVVVRDVIPANTRFSAITVTSGATALYHLYGAAADDYLSAAPADLAQVDAIAFVVDRILTGQSLTFTFTVRINNAAIGEVRNAAQAQFKDGVRDASADSNVLIISLPPFVPAIVYYRDNTFILSTRVARAGWPLYVQGFASGCNINPLAAETHSISIISKNTNDLETFSAIETGPNTGIFRVTPDVPTRSSVNNPVVRGNTIMEVANNDSLTATLNGCGAAAVTAVVLIDPVGVVFDSRSNATIAGATVTLIDVTGAGNGGRPGQAATVFQFDGVTPAPSTVTTGSDGRYQFPQLIPSIYALQIVAPSGFTYPSLVPIGQLPAGRTIDPSGSYGGNFPVSIDTGTVIIDVPMDSSTSGVLVVQKTAARRVAELGESLDYEIKIKNNSNATAVNVMVKDTLPTGFRYQAGSGTIDGKPLAEPAGGAGPALEFAIGDVKANSEAVLIYRVNIGAGASLGDATNRAFAQSGALTSNTASFRVSIQGGVFSDRGYVVGKVFADANGNSRQDAGELGVPGVRLYMEDGTYAITDMEGRYSFYNVSPRSHVLKLDTYSAPKNALLSSTGGRNFGDPGSIFLDMKAGEMRRADFALYSSDQALLTQEIASRRNATVSEQSEMGLATKQRTTLDESIRTVEELRNMPASGLVSFEGPRKEEDGKEIKKSEEKPAATAKAPGTAGSSSMTQTPATGEMQATGAVPDAVDGLDASLSFLGMEEAQVLPVAQTNIVVKGGAGTTFKLFVNGLEVPESRVGRRSVYEERQLQVWEYIGVAMQAGKNLVEVKQVDSFGNVREQEQITLMAPSKAARLLVETQQTDVAADGKTTLRFTVRLVDGNELPVTGRTPLTLEASMGKLLATDLDEREPGTQVFLTGGVASFELLSPIEPMRALLRVSTGNLRSEMPVDFVPELRPLIGAGVAEMTFDFAGGKRGARNSVRGLMTGFEEQVRSFAGDLGGDTNFASRMAMSLKGRVFDKYLLTLGYDSDKNLKNQLFRDVQPDRFYPIYGDGSIRGYDAQSTGKLYARVDRGRSYLAFGDFTTADSSFSQSLSTYMRSLNGMRQRYENSKLSFTTFASRDSLSQVVEEIPANGTSGPYTLSQILSIENSEKIEIVVRDRNQPAVVVSTTPKSRFVDYEFEAISGQLIFKSPIPTLDSRLNPVFIRVTYEMDQGGEKFWVGGAEGQWRATNRFQLGGKIVKDSNPRNTFDLYAVNTAFKFSDRTLFTGEVVQTGRQSLGSGLGYRMELKHEGAKLAGRLFFGRTDAAFDNPNASLSQGRGEFGLKGSYRLSNRTRLTSELLRTEDVKTGGNRLGGQISLERTLAGSMLMEVGFRHSQETASPSQPTSVGATPSESSSIITKITAQVPRFSKASFTAEYDQDVTDFQKKMAAIGGSYQILPSSRVYVRHELISSLGSQYALNANQSRNATVIGVDARYFKDLHVFSEFRDRDVLNGKEAEAAVGLTNAWHVAKGFVVNTGIESISTVSGKEKDALALTGGLEYTRSKSWRGSLRTEWRGSSTNTSFLSTAGIARQMTPSWTLLGRHLFNLSSNKTGTKGSRTQERLQIGGAYRPSGASKWNTMSMFELRMLEDSTQPKTAYDRLSFIFSTHANYQARPDLSFSGRYAAKFVTEKSRGIGSSSGIQLTSARVTYDFAKRFDTSMLVSGMFDPKNRSTVIGAGGELGYMVARNLWVSTGYNFMGFRSDDLTGEDITRRGAYIRLRFKFDENLLKLTKESNRR